MGILNTRTDSPSAHPRPASGGATDFFLASALRRQQTLRSPGEKDARCVQPMSATQTNCVYPAPRAFPVRSRRFRGGDAPRSLRLRMA